MNISYSTSSGVLYLFIYFHSRKIKKKIAAASASSRNVYII